MERRRIVARVPGSMLTEALAGSELTILERRRKRVMRAVGLSAKLEAVATALGLTLDARVEGGIQRDSSPPARQGIPRINIDEIVDRHRKSRS